MGRDENLEPEGGRSHHGAQFRLTRGASFRFWRLTFKSVDSNN